MAKNIPITVINLKKDIDRKNNITQQLNKLSLEFDFFDAIYGSNLSSDELNAAYNPKNSIEKGMKVLNKGEVGATLSHFSIYQKMINENIDRMVILEDDAIVGQNFVEALSVIEYLPQNWELCLLGYQSGRVSPCNFNIKIKNSPSSLKVGISPRARGGTFCYVINKKGAQRMLSYKDSLYQVIDRYTGNHCMVNVYVISPRVVEHSPDFESSVGYETENTPNWKKKKIIKSIRDFNRKRRKRRQKNGVFSVRCILRKIKFRMKYGFKGYS